MVFLAENYEMNQSYKYKIPSLAIENWGALLYKVLFS